MAELLSWMNPAQFFGGKDGAAVAALTVELSGAQACQYQSILERSSISDTLFYSFENRKLQLCF